jgi:hypothetical protein
MRDASINATKLITAGGRFPIAIPTATDCEKLVTKSEHAHTLNATTITICLLAADRESAHIAAARGVRIEKQGTT